jgi:hypothetical protein
MRLVYEMNWKVYEIDIGERNGNLWRGIKSKEGGSPDGNRLLC